MQKTLKNIVVIGDRILIKPLETPNKTGSGLYLPPSVKEKDTVHTGLVVKVGPGISIPANKEPDDFFQTENESLNFIPLQVKEGDEALYIHNNGYEIEFDGERYVVIPQSAVLLVIRSEILDSLDNL